ncbi:MAG: Beta-hexosaminidase [Pseudomonadota bacterium]|jgi:beta-N-acetylhexosaminidase
MSLPPPGPLLIDIQGSSLSPLDRERLSHPLVGGLILFTRNYVDPQQLGELCAAIHQLRPELLICVDHEGGRVQRFRPGFTRLPPMAALGRRWEADPAAALQLAEQTGWVLAAELRAAGVDFSFTPVLDLDYGHASVIGNRSFHRQPEVVARLAGALLRGLGRAGMASCGKHFPGHGWVEADSHVAIPVDERPLAALAEDMAPYRQVPLAAVMPAHVIYPQVDHRPAGFSPVWLGTLRQELAFSGVIFSDDLSMQGASVAGDSVARVTAAHEAGCDVLLLCNAPDQVGDVLARWQPQHASRDWAGELKPRGEARSWAELQADPEFQAARQAVAALLE